MAVFFVVSSALLFILSSCGKNIFEQDYSGFNGKVYIPGAAAGRDNFSIPVSSKPFILGFGAGYGGSMSAAPKDIPVSFALKEEWIATYNQEHNTYYEPLPAGSYSISGFNSVIKAGTTTSEPLTITIDRKILDINKKYMFPITLLSAGGEKIDSALTTAWYRIDGITRLERDVTSKGSIDVSHDNPGGPDAGEGSKKLTDNDYNSKFLMFDYDKRKPNFWYQLTFPQAIVLGAYTMTSGNDSPERDPKDWKLLGSNDGNNWDVLDSKAGQNFSGRNMTVRYEFKNEKAYEIYRMQITDNHDSWIFQQSEWRLIEFYEE